MPGWAVVWEVVLEMGLAWEVEDVHTQVVHCEEGREGDTEAHAARMAGAWAEDMTDMVGASCRAHGLDGELGEDRMAVSMRVVVPAAELVEVAEEGHMVQVDQEEVGDLEADRRMRAEGMSASNPEVRSQAHNRELQIHMEGTGEDRRELRGKAQTEDHSRAEARIWSQLTLELE
jgi:hypothetical protein